MFMCCIVLHTLVNVSANAALLQAHRERESQLECRVRELEGRVEECECERRRLEWGHRDQLEEKQKEIER